MLAQNPSSPCRSRSSCSRAWRCWWSSRRRFVKTWLCSSARRRRSCTPTRQAPDLVADRARERHRDGHPAEHDRVDQPRGPEQQGEHRDRACLQQQERGPEQEEVRIPPGTPEAADCPAHGEQARLSRRCLCRWRRNCGRDLDAARPAVRVVEMAAHRPALVVPVPDRHFDAAALPGEAAALGEAAARELPGQGRHAAGDLGRSMRPLVRVLALKDIGRAAAVN